MIRSFRKAASIRAQEKDWQLEHDRSAPKSGELAPDFTLYDRSGERTVSLSSYRGKTPVALIFGSST